MNRTIATVLRRIDRMKLLLGAVATVITLTDVAFGAGGGSSNSASSYSSSSSSYKKVDRFKEVHALIDQKQFRVAHTKLKAMAVKADEADRLNLLGFTARKSGNLNAAAEFYEQALKIHPRHRNALGYQGELYIQLGQIEKAKANLAKLEKICWMPCSAESDLRNSLAKTLMN